MFLWHITMFLTVQYWRSTWCQSMTLDLVDHNFKLVLQCYQHISTKSLCFHIAYWKKKKKEACCDWLYLCKYSNNTERIYKESDVLLEKGIRTFGNHLIFKLSLIYNNDLFTILLCRRQPNIHRHSTVVCFFSQHTYVNSD